MNANLKPYIRQFSLYYFLGYLILLPLLIIIDNIWHLHGSDFIILISLSMAIPYLTCDKFVKNEGRFFSDDEQKLFVKKSALIGMFISLIPLVLYSGTLLFINLFASPDAMLFLMLQQPMNTMQSDMLSLNSVTIIAITLFSAGLYYLVIRLSVNSTIKSLRKKYEKTQKIKN